MVINLWLYFIHCTILGINKYLHSLPNKIYSFFCSWCANKFSVCKKFRSFEFHLNINLWSKKYDRKSVCNPEQSCIIFWQGKAQAKKNISKNVHPNIKMFFSAKCTQPTRQTVPIFVIFWWRICWWIRYSVWWRHNRMLLSDMNHSVSVTLGIPSYTCRLILINIQSSTLNSNTKSDPFTSTTDRHPNLLVIFVSFVFHYQNVERKLCKYFLAEKYRTLLFVFTITLKSRRDMMIFLFEEFFCFVGRDWTFEQFLILCDIK